MTKTLMIVTTLTLALFTAGCNTCRQATSSWFNKGDKCAVYPPNCPPGGPQATMMMPSSPQVLPGPIEISPQP